jgi:hypothetical protein
MYPFNYLPSYTSFAVLLSKSHRGTSQKVFVVVRHNWNSAYSERFLI